MNPETTDPKDVAACLEKVRATLGELDELQDSLKRRAVTLAASAEDIKGRLRSIGIDTPEAIEEICASLDEETKASARSAASVAPTVSVSGKAPKTRNVGRMV